MQNREYTKKGILSVLLILVLAVSIGNSATTIITKALLGEQDIHHYDGVNSTFTRATSTGGTMTLNSVGTEVDVLAAYGGNVNYNSTSINAAITAIATNTATLVLRPGTWTLSADVTIPSNIVLHCPKGVSISTSFGYTLTVNGLLSGWPSLSGGGTVTINYTSVASAATINLAALVSNYVHVTGNTGPIVSLGVVPSGHEYTLVFDSTPTITHDGTSLIMPGAANMTMAAGDVLRFRSEGTGNWRCIGHNASASVERTLLGLGTMAVQSASSVSITGGSITGASSLTTTTYPVFYSAYNAESENGLALASRDTANAMNLVFYRYLDEYYYIQSVKQGVASKDLRLNPTGGTVYAGDGKVVTSALSTGTSTTPSGTIIAVIGGTTVFLLKSATAD